MQQKVSDGEGLSLLSNGEATLEPMPTPEYVIEVTYQARKHYIISGDVTSADPRGAYKYGEHSAKFFSMKLRDAGRNPKGNQPYLITARPVSLSEAILDYTKSLAKFLGDAQ